MKTNKNINKKTERQKKKRRSNRHTHISLWAAVAVAATRKDSSLLLTITFERCACDHFTLYTFPFRFLRRLLVHYTYTHTHSQRTHISWPLEIRYPPGSSERMRCLRMRERATCLYYLTTAYICICGKDVTRTHARRREIPLILFSVNLIATEQMTVTVAPDATSTMQLKEMNGAPKSAQRKTNRKKTIFLSNLVCKMVRLICWTISHTRAVGAVGAMPHQPLQTQETNEETKKNVRKCISSVWISMYASLRCYSILFILYFSFFFYHSESYVVINRWQSSASGHLMAHDFDRQSLM